MKILVGVDGSEQSFRAVSWCVEHAPALGAEVVAVHAIELPVYPSIAGMSPIPVPVYELADREKLRAVMEEKWCEPLTRAGVPVRMVLGDGYAPDVVRRVAADEDADLVVVGRRGLGSLSAMLLGSTSRELAHHLERPLVIVP